MAWIALLFAGFCEMLGVTMINQWHKDRKWYSFAFLVAGFAASFLFLAYAMQSLSMGTAYAVWTGIGTVGGTFIGMFFYGESKDWKRLLFISMVLAAAVGLKLIS